MPVWSRLRRVHVGVAALALVAITSLAACGGGSSTVSSSKEKATTTTTTIPASPPSAVPGAGSPQIVKFATDQTQVPCHGTKSSSLTLSWGTENSVNVSLRIDGPKIFNTYPPTGSAVVPYPCPASQHTYLLTANGPNGQTSSQAITVRTVGTPPAPPTTAASTTTSTAAPTTTTTTVAPTTPTTAPTVTKVAVEFTSPARHTYLLTVQPTNSPSATVEFTVKNSSDTEQDFVVLKTDLPFDQLPVDPHTHQVSEADKVGKIPRIDRDQTKTLHLTLAVGQYVLVSNLPFHYQRGARAAFSAVTTPPTS